jgi:dihydrofolate reductase
MLTLAALVAVSTNHVIGKADKLPWHLPADLQYFKRLTTGQAVLMGRKTYLSIGKPLPNRLNLVLSRQSTLQLAGTTIVQNLTAAANIATGQGYQQLFVIGGAEVYKQLLPFCQKLYLTAVATEVENGDAFFELNTQDWAEKSSTFYKADEKNQYDMRFLEYENLRLRVF